MAYENRKRKVLVLGGSHGQLHMIRLVQKLECLALVADVDVNCPGHDQADGFFAVSTAAVKDLISLAKEEQVDFVVSAQSDLGAVSAAKINDALGLPGISLKSATLFSNKLSMRRFLQEQGWPCPAFRHCRSQEDVCSFASAYGLPFVVKPLDSQGSRGVHIVRSEQDLEGIMSIGQYDRDTKGVLAEEFLPGEEYTVEGVVVDGKHHTLAVSRKRHYSDLDCVSNQLLYGWKDGYDELTREHDRLIDATGLEMGATHSEYIKTENGFVLVEFAARGGGSLIASRIVPSISGWDPEEIYLREVLGRSLHLQSKQHGWAVLEFINLRTKKIKDVRGLDVVRSLPGVLDCQMAYGVGEVPLPVSNDTNRHGFYIATAETEDGLHKVMKQVQDGLRIEYEPEGKEMGSPVAWKFSKKVERIPEALSVYMNNLVYQMKRKGEHITTLSLGEAYFDFPFYGFEGIDIKSGYHYSESRGLLGLRKKIASYYGRNYGARVDGDQEVLISAGSKPLLFMALQAVLNPGDEVLICEPAWLSYPEQIKLADGVPVYIPYDCKPCDFGRYVTSRTRALIVNNPNNPAGKIYGRSELEVLYQLCRSSGIWLLVDEAYSDFVTDGSFDSILSIVPEKNGIIAINSLSKNLGISGWRIGYVIASPETIYHILKLNQHLLTCASTILLMYLELHFEELLAHTLPQARQVTVKRNRLEKYIRNLGMETLGGTSTFYIFINTEKYKRTSLDLALYLLFRYHIAVVPGSAYGKSTEKFIRIGVGVVDDEEIKVALEILHRVIENQEYDAGLIKSCLAEC